MSERFEKARSVLQAYIDEHFSGSVNAFALKKHLAQSELSKFLRGQKKRFSLGFATRLVEATDGEIKIEMLQPPRASR